MNWAHLTVYVDDISCVGHAVLCWSRVLQGIVARCNIGKDGIGVQGWNRIDIYRICTFTISRMEQVFMTTSVPAVAR
jgi:hypothetical protein